MAAAAPTYDRMKELKAFDDSKIGVKGLSDSGIASIPKFFVHPPENLSELKPSAVSASAAGIPVIDFAGLSAGGSHRRSIVDQVREAAGAWGFFQVVNHGIPPQVLDDTTLAIKSFHDQPPEAKAKHYVRDELRGVMYGINNDLYRSKAASWHDYLQVHMAPEAAAAEDIPEICRKEAVAWDKHATGVAETVLGLLSEGLGLEPGRFKELTFAGVRLFVGTCYPYCPQPDLTVGIKSHTDPGSVTVLLTNRVAGLQVKHENQWVDVRPLPGALTINIGDFLQIISNGEYKSVEHRVLANPSKEAKISVVMFFNVANWKGSPGYYGPLPELVTPQKPAIYRNFTQQEFNDNFYGKGLDSKSLIEKIKIQN